MIGFTFRVVVAVKRIVQFRCEVLRFVLMMRCRVRCNGADACPGQEQPEQGQASGNRAEATHPLIVYRARQRAQVCHTRWNANTLNVGLGGTLGGRLRRGAQGYGPRPFADSVASLHAHRLCSVRFRGKRGRSWSPGEISQPNSFSRRRPPVSDGREENRFDPGSPHPFRSPDFRVCARADATGGLAARRAMPRTCS